MFDKEALEKIKERQEQWEETTLQQWLARLPERDELFRNLSDMPIARLYTPADIPDFDYLEELGFPGEYPFTRGIHATMYRGRLWTMRMFSGYGSAEETNERFKYLLKHGETGLSVAFDTPTLYGYDTDDPMAEGEFGKCGVAVSSLADMEILFDGIPLDKVTTSMTYKRSGRYTVGNVPCCGREARDTMDQNRRHYPERYPQRIHCSEGVRFPSQALHAPDSGHF
jgi:methylmalonyl-CoA mutase N-terminal domain/subunit